MVVSSGQIVVATALSSKPHTVRSPGTSSPRRCATATVAAYVGLGGLGRFLIDGLATQDYASTAGGALLVALLALALDVPFALLGRLVVSPGLTGRSRSLRPTTDHNRTATAGGTP